MLDLRGERSTSMEGSTMRAFSSSPDQNQMAGASVVDPPIKYNPFDSVAQKHEENIGGIVDLNV